MQSRNEALRVFVRHQKEVEGRTYISIANALGMKRPQLSRWLNGRDAGEDMLRRLEQLYTLYK